MPKRTVHVPGFMSPITLVLMFGALLALVGIATQVQYVIFFKAFLITVVPITLIYAIVVSAKKGSGMVLLFLVFVGFFMALGLEQMPNLLPFQFVPMDLLGLPQPNVSAGSIAVPDAIWMLGVATIFGLVLAVTHRQKHAPIVVLSIAIAFYASTAILSSLFFGKWGEWMILLTPFTGLPWIGLAFAIAYIALAFGIWEQSKVAFWIYLIVQFVAIGYAVLLQQWLSTIFSVLIISYLFIARGRFTHKMPVPEVPSL